MPQGDLSELEEKQIQAWRAELAAERAAEQTRRDHEAFGRFADRKAESARKSNDDHRAEVWSQAASNIRKGLWTYDKVIGSDPEIVAYQSMRQALLYKGATAKVS